MPEYKSDKDVAHLERRVTYLEQKLEEAKMDWLDQAALAYVVAGYGHPVAYQRAEELWFARDKHRKVMKNRDARGEGCQCEACRRDGPHTSDCAVHTEPAYPVGPCSCGQRAKHLRTVRSLKRTDLNKGGVDAN